jgi:hypothetical protein
MSISIGSTGSSAAANATAWLSKALQAEGVSTAGASAVAGDLLNAAETSLSANPNESDSDFSAALDKQINQDVASGKLSQDDADAIKKALDTMTGASQDSAAAAPGGDTAAVQASSSAADSAQAAGDAGGGRGGGGGASTGRTEVSQTVTVSGDTKTTVITYSDGTTEIETATATTADQQKYDKKAAGAGDGADARKGARTAAAKSAADQRQAAQDYLAQMPAGTLFQKAA